MSDERPKRRLLKYLQVADRAILSTRPRALRELPAGAHHVEIQTEVDRALDLMTVRMTALMLTEHAGEAETKEFTTTFRYTAPIRPRWLPLLLWRRIPWREVAIPRKATLTVQPIWKYPHATEIQPLGRPIEAVEVWPEHFTESWHR